MPTVIIGADICPIEINRPYFENGDAKSLFNDLLPEFEAADLVIANLECPLIERQNPIAKTGPVFGESSNCIKGIKAAGIDVLGLANNHILDHGGEGLRNTLEVCARAGIATFGAGENLAAARRLLIRDLAGVRVAVLGVAEHEFSIARQDSWGANPLDIVDLVRNLKAHQDQFDYLIVLAHGGDEFQVPTPRLQDTCRFLIELGAGAVIVQHPHVLGGYEQYRGGHIVYGQGALIMDEAIYRDSGSFHEGFLVKLSVGKDADAKLDIIPFTQSAPPPGARKVGPAKEQRFRTALEKRSVLVRDDAALQAEWLWFCERNKHDYMSNLLGHNRVLAKLNRRGGVEKLLHGRQALLRARNIALCETHREAIETIFNQNLV